tara:strand:+ start:1556 stop:4324 length:2769 start_codon:yes stop_codon:yes gene_type:complete
MSQIDKLIINNPYDEPPKYWDYNRETLSFSINHGRRPAGYIIATPNSKSYNDPGIFIKIDSVNKIRQRVNKWRNNNYPGVTSVTKRLLDHWVDPDERKDRRFFFCQLEAIETIIWLTEAPDSEKVGIDIKGDGGEFERWCNKMATGTGKTVVMSMLIAWNVLNKVTYPQDTRFSKNVLIIAPGLTVKSRLQVLHPTNSDNYYDEFNIVPSAMMDKLRLANIKIHNWHTLAWESEQQLEKKKTVDKRGALSDEAYVRQVMGNMQNAKNLIVINDEAHHAWRVNPESVGKYTRTRDMKDSATEATIWIGGLDRIHAKRGILRCYDLSATPFTPSGNKSSEEALFSWIISDFGLNDAIEAGLVKTPRVVIRDDSERTKELKSRLYHIYADDEVKDDINRKADESDPLPDLLINAYYLLGLDWKETKQAWIDAGHIIPPVMITVANRTETSSRIKFSFDHNQIQIPELCDEEKTLQIDSKILQKAESFTEKIDIEGKAKLSQSDKMELLRQKVDSVGKPGQPGEQLQNIISVGMLSEGWDAKNVTHIMGLRAFTSQLLCEQVVGRGLRRISYDVGEDGLFEAEYVNIFGVPFTFLPHEGGEGSPPPPPKPKTLIGPLNDKIKYEISWPNVVRVDHIYQSKLMLDWNKATELTLNPFDTITSAELASIISGKPNPAQLTEIELNKIAKETRMQTIVFKISASICNAEKIDNYKGSKEQFLAQLIDIVNDFIESDKLVIKNDEFAKDEIKRKVLILLNMNTIVQHIWNEVRAENTEKLMPIFDTEIPIRSTSQVRPWYTSKPCEIVGKSHISHCVYDSGWEATEAYTIEKSSLVDSFVKNDHLGFCIMYNHKGIIRKYFPDFIIKLSNGSHLILETKGVDSQQNQTKRKFLEEWVKAINNQGGFGVWNSDVSFDPSDVEGILNKYSNK